MMRLTLKKVHVAALAFFSVILIWYLKSYSGSQQLICNSSQYYSSTNRDFPCSCEKGRSTKQSEGHWCSEESSERGHHQKIVAYSVYGNAENANISARYFSLIEKTASQLKAIYPGWTMRIYHNYDKTQLEVVPKLCEAYCKFPHVDLCDINRIRQDEVVTQLISEEDLQSLHPSVWRFLALADRQVDIFMSRDIDSEIYSREVDAVNQWLQSDYTFHVMRDHPYHESIMLAGLWGAKLVRNRQQIETAFLSMIPEGRQDNIAGKWTDQFILAKYMWPLASTDVMAHDSYTCKRTLIRKASRLATFPFPSKRRDEREVVGGIYVRMQNSNETLPPCPHSCRPKEHPDWELC